MSVRGNTGRKSASTINVRLNHARHENNRSSFGAFGLAHQPDLMLKLTAAVGWTDGARGPDFVHRPDFADPWLSSLPLYKLAYLFNPLFKKFSTAQNYDSRKRPQPISDTCKEFKSEKQHCSSGFCQSIVKNG